MHLRNHMFDACFIIGVGKFFMKLYTIHKYTIIYNIQSTSQKFEHVKLPIKESDSLASHDLATTVEFWGSLTGE